MFYTLHRLVKGMVWLAVLGLLHWLWQQREALEPIYAWHDVYQNGGIEQTEPLPRIEGRGLQVVDGHTFTILSDKRVFNVRLTGFEIPQPPLSLPEIQIEKTRREHLRALVLSNHVHVEVTYSNLNSLLGVAHVGATNLNIYFLTNDLSKFNRDYIKSAPRDSQYKFFSAARAHRKWKAAREKKLALSN